MNAYNKFQNVKLFSKEWFHLWQTFLLIMVNFPILSIREEIRFRLGIILERNILINKLYPNSFRIKINKNEFTHTFYGKNVFAEAIAIEWNYLWQLIHKWDMSFANKYIPALNFGFDTLTVYPEQVQNATKSISGSLYADSSSAASIDVTRGLQTASGKSLYVTVGGSLYNELSKYRLNRGITYFDTSSLGESVILSQFVWYGYVAVDDSVYTTDGSVVYLITGGALANNYEIVYDDYRTSRIGDTIISNLSPSFFNISQISAGGYITSTCTHSTTLNLIINKVGTTKITLKTDVDQYGYNPMGFNYLVFHGTDSTSNNAQRPKLVVTYTLPASQKQCMII